MQKHLAWLAGGLLVLLLAWFGYGIWDANRTLVGAMNAALTQVTGNPQGKLTVVEFVDYRCPYCAMMHERMSQVIATDPDLRVVIRPVPWLGQDSAQIARLFVAAAEQNKAMVLHQALMATGGVQDYAEARGIAQDLGIDIIRAERTMRDPSTDAALRFNMSILQRLQIDRIPALIIHGQPFAVKTEADMPSVAKLREMIAAQR